jgi:hypothetical protein
VRRNLSAPRQEPGQPERDRESAVASVRPIYQPPVLERLGAWQAVTLQQSIPIF